MGHRSKKGEGSDLNCCSTKHAFINCILKAAFSFKAVVIAYRKGSAWQSTVMLLEGMQNGSVYGLAFLFVCS